MQQPHLDAKRPPASSRQDFNYETPFLGKEEVTAFVTAFDIPGIEARILLMSEAILLRRIGAARDCLD